MAMPSSADDRTMNSRRVKPTNIVLFLAILINHEIKVDSLIVQGPSDTTAMVNESTYFNCSTSIRPIDEQSIIWYHYPLDRGGQRDDVYDEGIIRTNYIERFEIDIDLSSGSLNLIALRLEPKDAGRYECKDHVHKGIGASAELTVLGSDLVCETDMDPGGVLGPTQCERAIEPDEIQLSCSVTYYNGKNAPQMVWGKSGDSSNSTKTDCVNNDNRVTCNTTLTANLQLNESVYMCELPTQQHYCSLKMENILYAFANTTQTDYDIGDEVTCVANASRQLPCLYQWYEENSTTAFSNETFKPNNSGIYRCQAQCVIREDSCKFTAMVINVSTVPDPSKLRNTAKISYIVGGCLSLLLFIGLFLVIWYRSKLSRCLRQCRCCKRNERPPFGETEDPPAAVNPLLGQQAEDKKTTSSQTQVIELKGYITHDRIERYRKWLEECMDPESGLLDTLLARGTLSGKETSEVKGKSTFYTRNCQLLDYIVEKRQGDRLIEALRDTEQLHIVNYLKGNGEYSPEYGEDWPLTPKEISILNTSRESFIDLLRLNDLPGRLYFSKVINKRQMNLISSKPNTYSTTEEKFDILLRRSKATALLDILRRRSIRDYRQTILCLHQSDQSHIAAILETGGDVDPGAPQIEHTEPQIDNPSTKYDYYPDILGAIKIAAAKKKVIVITGLTILHEELFIVRELSSEVEVYHATEFTFIRRCGIRVADPGGIESCNCNQCLYIVGWKTSGGSRTILRVDPQGEQITEWLVANNWSYLSVTYDSNVLLTFQEETVQEETIQEETVQEETKLIEYSPNGQLIRIIKLSSDACMFIKNPWRSVKLDSGNFVVCCGLEDDDLHGVFIVSEYGAIRKLFGRNKDFNTARLNQPVHLVVDKDRFVLVADSRNSRVLLFNSKLEYQKELLYKENSDLQCPSILYWDESRGLLYVVDNGHDGDECKVLIFRLR